MSIDLTQKTQLLRLSRVSNIGFCSSGVNNDSAILFRFNETIVNSFSWVGWNIKDVQFLNGQQRLGILLEQYTANGANIDVIIRMIIMDFTGSVVNDSNVLTRTVPFSSDLKFPIHLFSVDAKENVFLFLFRVYNGNMESLEWNYSTNITTITDLSFQITENVSEQQTYKLVGNNDLFFIARKNSKYIYRYDISTKDIENWITLPGVGGFITNNGSYSQETGVIVNTNGDKLYTTSDSNILAININMKMIEKTIPIGLQDQIIGVEYYSGEKPYIVVLKKDYLEAYDPYLSSAPYLIASKQFSFDLEQFSFDRILGLTITVGTDENSNLKLNIYKIFANAISYVGGFFITDVINDVLVDFASEQVIYTTENSNLIVFRNLMNGYVLQLASSEKTFEYDWNAKIIYVTGKLTDASETPIEGVTINWEIIPDANVSADLSHNSSITNINGYANTQITMKGVGKCRINGTIVS